MQSLPPPFTGPATQGYVHERKAELLQLLAAPLPSIACIRQQLQLTRATTIAELILENPGLEFTLDYYFRLLPPRLGAQIIGDPRFPTRVAVRLFYCQILRANVAAGVKQQPGLEAYWRAVPRKKLSLVLRELLRLGENRDDLRLFLRDLEDSDALI